MQISIPSIPFRKPAIKRCAICKRPIKLNAKHVADTGNVGDDCYSRVSGFETWLKANGLLEVVQGGLFVSNADAKLKATFLLQTWDKLKAAGFVVDVSRTEHNDYLMNVYKLGSRAHFLEALERGDFKVAS